jgi:hypothetical protein
MQFRQMSNEDVKNYLLTNWMTHDALWYRDVASTFGMAQASPMNLRVCRNLGRIEFRRLLKATRSNPPKDMAEVKLLYEEARRILVPPFFEGDMDFQGDNSILFKTRTCFAYSGMKEAGLIDEYECGIFERIEGWFDAMGLEYLRTPDLSRCLKYRGQECNVLVLIHFK